MKAELLERTRIQIDDDAFVEMVLWRVPEPVPGSAHGYKYRLALVESGVCALRYDNEAGKGDHVHRGTEQWPYKFSTVDRLMSDFLGEVAKRRRQ